MALRPMTLAEVSNIIARTEQIENALQRLETDVSICLPNTGASDVYAGALRAARAARQKVRIELANALYLESRDGARD